MSRPRHRKTNTADHESIQRVREAVLFVFLFDIVSATENYLIEQYGLDSLNLKPKLVTLLMHGLNVTDERKLADHVLFLCAHNPRRLYDCLGKEAQRIKIELMRRRLARLNLETETDYIAYLHALRQPRGRHEESGLQCEQTQQQKQRRAKHEMLRQQCEDEDEFAYLLETLEFREHLERLQEVPERYRRVLTMRWGIGQSREFTLDEIARACGASLEDVRQLYKAGLVRLLAVRRYEDALDLLGENLNTTSSKGGLSVTGPLSDSGSLAMPPNLTGKENNDLLGYADPRDATWGLGRHFRDGGRFGSPVSYDSYDDESLP